MLDNLMTADHPHKPPRSPQARTLPGWNAGPLGAWPERRTCVITIKRGFDLFRRDPGRRPGVWGPREKRCISAQALEAGKAEVRSEAWSSLQRREAYHPGPAAMV